MSSARGKLHASNVGNSAGVPGSASGTLSARSSLHGTHTRSVSAKPASQEAYMLSILKKPRWQTIRVQVKAVFQGQRPKISETSEVIRDVAEHGVSTCFQVLKQLLFPQGFIHDRTQLVEMATGGGAESSLKVVSALLDDWAKFYYITMPRLEALFCHLETHAMKVGQTSSRIRTLSMQAFAGGIVCHRDSADLIFIATQSLKDSGQMSEPMRSGLQFMLLNLVSEMHGEAGSDRLIALLHLIEVPYLYSPVHDMVDDAPMQ